MDWVLIGSVATVVGSLATLYAIVKNRRRLKRRVAVKVSWGMLTFPNGGLSDPMIFVTVTNPGDRAVVVNVPYFQLPRNKKMYFPNYQSSIRFPYRLEEGECCQMWVKESGVIDTLRDEGFKGRVRIRAFIDDQADGHYRARKVYKMKV
jgi:hypothetical protein